MPEQLEDNTIISWHRVSVLDRRVENEKEGDSIASCYAPPAPRQVPALTFSGGSPPLRPARIHTSPAWST